MSIKDFIGKIKGGRGFRVPKLPLIPDDLYLGLIIILVAFGSFGLGRLSKIEESRVPIRIENVPVVTEGTFNAPSTGVLAENQPTATDTTDLVGSKNGRKYYYPWCSGVSNILPANIIHFSSKSDALARGYTPSATCKGI